MKTKMTAQFWTLFLTGLFTLLPIFLTFYLISWFVVFIENTLRGLFFVFTPNPLYFPGMGLVITALIVFGVGLTMRSLFVRRIYQRLEWGLESIPLLKSIYTAIRDFVGFVASSRERQNSQVVLVKIDALGAKALGLVTRQSLEGFPAPIGQGDLVAVYIPMSYQLGGYTLMVPRAKLEPVEMKVEDALGYALTGWVRQSPRGSSDSSADQ